MKYLLNGLESARLRFRLLKESDYEDWLPFFADKEIYKFLFLDFNQTQNELCRFWMDKAFARYDDGRGGMMVLEEKSTGKMVGQCGLLIQEMDGDRRLEVGYSLLPKYRGLGYAIEAARFTKEFAFAKAYDRHFDNLVVSMIHVENQPSIDVALKNDMQWMKTFTDTNGEQFHIYGQTRAAWEASVK